MLYRLPLRDIAGLLLLTSLIGCTADVVQPPSVQRTPSFQHIQSRIFSVSCTQCHTEPASDYFGGLALTSADTSFKLLIDRQPLNGAARSAGLKRVLPGYPDSSFLLKKLTGDLAPGMGDPMPQHLASLSSGKIEFIRRWIAAGAPRLDSVADPALLEDDQTQHPLVPLPVPDPAKGFQIHMDTFQIASASEREIFVYQSRDVADSQFVNRVQIRMREGSHHLVLYTLNGDYEGTIPGEIRDNIVLEQQRYSRKYVFGAQTTESELILPDSIAFAIAPTVGFDLNSHYVNPSESTYVGEAYINVFTVPQSQVKHVAVPLLMNDGNFTIPPNDFSPRIKFWPAVSKRTHFIMVTSHHHKRMKSFKLFISGGPRNGQLIFENFDWHNPPVKQMDLVLNPGERLRSETVWNNETDKPISFGFTSEDEMNIVLGYYWEE